MAVVSSCCEVFWLTPVTGATPLLIAYCDKNSPIYYLIVYYIKYGYKNFNSKINKLLVEAGD